MVAHDGARLSALFIPEGSTWLNVLTQPAFERATARSSGARKVRISSYSAFARFLPESKSDSDAVHSDVDIRTDGTAASGHFRFKSLVDRKTENQGEEMWQLVKDVAGWRIAAIAYSSGPVQ